MSAEIFKNAKRFRSFSTVTLIACFFLLIIFAFVARSASSGKSATFDEPVTLVAAWAKTHYGDFRCDPEDPPLPHYFIAAGTSPEEMLDRRQPLWDQMLHSMLAEGWYAFVTLYQTPINRPDVLINAARARMIFLGVLIGVIVTWWAWRWRGPLAGFIAAIAFCFDPNFLAHSPLLKNDAPMALAWIALSAAIWLVGERATLMRCLCAAVLLGIVLTTKYSGLLALPMIALTFAFRAICDQPWQMLGRVAQTRSQRLVRAAAIYLAMLVIAFIFIWASYEFRFEISSDPQHPFDTQAALTLCKLREAIVAHGSPPNPTPEETRQWVAEWQPSLSIQTLLWALDHHLLPQAWLIGLLFIHATSIIRATLLCGQLNMTGWWYYFPLAMLFKTPLATLIAIPLAIVGVLSRLRKKRSGNYWPWVALLLPPVLFMTAAMTTHLNVGLRHILPVYPFIFIFLGVVAADVWHRKPKVARLVIPVLCLGLVAETAHAYPDYIPFFNVAAGGPSGGLKLLSDSNLDWGQDLPSLKQWQQDHPDRPVYLLYFGAADPHYYGFSRLIEPGAKTLPGLQPPPTPGAVFAISATVMQGVYTPDQRDLYEPFLHGKPLAILGGTIYVFDWP